MLLLLCIFIIQSNALGNEYKEILYLTSNEIKTLKYPTMIAPMCIFQPALEGEYTIHNDETSCTVTIKSTTEQNVNFTIYNTHNGLKMLKVNAFSEEAILQTIFQNISFITFLVYCLLFILFISLAVKFIKSLLDVITDIFFNKGKIVVDTFNKKFGILPEDYIYLVTNKQFFSRADEIARRFPEYNIPTAEEKRRYKEKQKQQENNKCFGLKAQRLDLLVITGVVVGIIFGYNFVEIFLGDTPIHLFFCLLFLYHFFEFTSSVYPRPYKAQLHDFMLFHSPHFMCALIVALLEYYIEKYFFPELKQHVWISVLFALITLVFQGFRTIAMYVAGSNFNHYIETNHRHDHILVTTGIYKHLRHPSYFGWFWWSICTQVVMLNPISVILYALAAWYFFYLRIPYEEETLIKLFGDEYKEYKKRTFIGIPFIRT